jgi:hypothetical protein
MASKPVTVETTKQLAALRQIKASIIHFHKREYEAAITLAGAAEGQIPEPTMTYLFRLLKRHMSSDEANAYIHWMKHQSGADKASIPDFEVVLTISRAIHKFVGAYKASCDEFEEFSAWAVEKGHIPRPLTTKQL